MGVEAGVSVGGDAGDVFGDAISTSGVAGTPCAASTLAGVTPAPRPRPLPLPRPRPLPRVVVGASSGGMVVYPDYGIGVYFVVEEEVMVHAMRGLMIVNGCCERGGVQSTL